VLEHADGGYLVEASVEPRVILQLERDAIPKPEPRDFLHGIGILILRQGHAVRAHAVMLSRVADERTPAAADVEERLAGFQPQLAADHVELIALGLGDVVMPFAEIGAAIDHLRIEKE